MNIETVERMLRYAKKDLKALEDNLYNAINYNNTEAVAENESKIQFVKGRIYALEELIEYYK